jgi:hypothetical protein
MLLLFFPENSIFNSHLFYPFKQNKTQVKKIMLIRKAGLIRFQISSLSADIKNIHISIG